MIKQMCMDKLIHSKSKKYILLIDPYQWHRNILKYCTQSTVVQSSESSTKSIIDKENSKLFFSNPVQELMRKLTGLDFDKIFRVRAVREKVKAATYKFMTTKQLQKAQEEALKKAYKKLQVPPLVPINEAKTEVIQEVPQLLGVDQSNYVFTDISFGISDRQRMILVRQTNGILRKASPFERHRMNEIYFPREGREYLHPPMFQEENLQPLWEKNEFEFILDRACCQFEPDDPEFHEVTFKTYDKIDEKKAYNILRSTRHFGSLIFYLCLKKNIDNLLIENLEHDRIKDAVLAIKLYSLVNSQCRFNSLNIDRNNPELTLEEDIKLIKSFIETESFKREELLSLLESYNDVREASKSKM